MSTLNQRSFSAGEFTPELYSRVDTSKYQQGLRQCINMQVMKTGGLENRPGSEFICEVKDSTKAVRYIPFVFSDSQTYVLEFGNLYMRVVKQGVQLTLAAQNITGITNANPCVVTYSGSDTYSNGDEVYISGIVGAIGIYLNNRNFKIASVNTGANTFVLQYMDGSNVNSTSMGAYTSGGSIEEVYELATPYAEADLPNLQYAQSGDTITIVHPSYAPRDLIRTGDTSWSLSTIVFEPSIARPSTLAYISIDPGLYYKFIITAVDANTNEESLPGFGLARNITGITKANPGVITSNLHGFYNYDLIYIENIVGMTELNNKFFYVFNTAVNTFTLLDYDTLAPIDTTGFTAYSSGGTMKRMHISAFNVGTSLALSWDVVPNAAYYKIYVALDPLGPIERVATGLISLATANSFSSALPLTLVPDYNSPHPRNRKPFDSANNYPSCVGYTQQRKAFANTNNNPETTWLSHIGSYKNFRIGYPIKDNESVTYTIAGRKVNTIRHLVDLERFVKFTQDAEIVVQGGADGVIRPGEINPKVQSNNGASSLRPLIVDTSALYAQARGSIIRDLLYNYQVDKYQGNDLTIFSKHLFEGYTIVDWDYQLNSNSIVWAVRSDGVLLGLTYVRDQQIVGWHRHVFKDAFVENVVVVPEGNEDAVYLVVKRTINSRQVKYIERLSNRFINDLIDNKFMDSFLSYDGRYTGAISMTLSGGTTWAYDETLTLTSSSSYFSSADVGNEIHLVGSDGSLIRFKINAYTSGTVVTGNAHKTVPVAMRSIAISYNAKLGTSWSKAVDKLSGIWHLEGKSVSVFADRFVVGSPNNASYPVYTVTNGSITLDKCYSVIHVGLPYLSDSETLDVDTANGEAVVDKRTNITEVSLRLHKSRSCWIGSSPPSDDNVNPLEGLTELKIRNIENYDSPVSLKSDIVNVQIESHWNSNGRVFIRNVDPVPLTITAIYPSGFIPVR